MDTESLLRLYASRGDLKYAGEGVTQLDHAWQCAGLARASGASTALQLAAWLHDVGHLLASARGTPTLFGHDDRHEHAGAGLLYPLFGDAVAQPVALHVEAKRYLVATHPAYRGRLSADSCRSLSLQGGVMDAAECTAFRANPFAGDALRLRAWDDMAKDARKRPNSQVTALRELDALIKKALGQPDDRGHAASELPVAKA